MMSPFYVPLEQASLCDAHPSFDIWALGITGYTLMAKKEPYTQVDASSRFKAITASQREILSDYYSKDLRDLIDYLLTFD